VKAVRSALFTDANIVAGSMTVSYDFDEEGAADGVEIEYLDPKDFRQSYTTWPTNALRPDRFTLPGVTNASHAGQYARLTWQRSQGQRKRITFDTELEGLILQLGDRIGVSHNVPKWGDGGLVIGQSGNTLTVDHNLDWSGGAKQILLRKPDGGVTDPISVTRGGYDNKVVLASAAPTTINFDNDYEYTSFAFGSSTTLVRDFVVVSVRPGEDNKVTIEAVNYAPTIFASTMSFLS
jgi:predicted phage tail protein